MYNGDLKLEIHKFRELWKKKQVSADFYFFLLAAPLPMYRHTHTHTSYSRALNIAFTRKNGE